MEGAREGAREEVVARRVCVQLLLAHQQACVLVCLATRWLMRPSSAPVTSPYRTQPQRSSFSPLGTLQNPFYKGVRAKEYDFKLDPFQETAVACLVSRPRLSEQLTHP